ncbi:bifunctional diaminohydroxyphosphoribosylaminopyrimidine deaminase/5-amino-6-(5-phosphoribosylamino)uracil reductase RibD [Pseudoclavibacter sp. 13-3]|uniref:bifunctional diaminohydroxyphosphoribosylaminopyrimidine deaminase/5-amino-6-(5-phosphoribosylamino)uracil reductase RibD n=1 Tax=Pseudoclavibacter sp. 13-3 TaxID=2901228 RepID=UPI001E63A4ED|nr:bifunctional diaminohydroxyphosphoribosylaminopyrimidine deaminase/5-amino-6-(5-phosphoribosylamino)uracil reductase RibD [Pseudoclavibacter sp. 13-3]MCD7102404.1 bifunctional diaminohydroxyphosphoribosylaminopyrimidine deaminase/5-amino-6-(5-phosphoribosylamino)uracil reductase RibD [Pseudoclavibacter sp. 13-3]
MSEPLPVEITAMRRALDLAQRGPLSGGNPRVGCVLLGADGVPLAEGWHHGAGTAHAEVDALTQVSAQQARGATAVVSLEPCDHVGRTGPCSQALIDAGVARVVYAVDDPGDASAHGAERLAANGVEVVSGVLHDEAEQVNHDWFAAMRRRRPWVIAKLAMSLDGRAAAADGSSRWITSPESRAHAHVVRGEVDGIIVGAGTVAADDPALTARFADGSLRTHQPVPVVLGTAPGSSLGARLRAAHDRVVDAPLDLRALRVQPGCRVRPQLIDLLGALFDGDDAMRRVLVEGGPTTTSLFLRAGLVDELHVYSAPVLIGGPRLAVQQIDVAGIGDALRLTDVTTTPLGPDVLWRARIEGDGSLG